MTAGLSAMAGVPDQLMIDATHLKVRRRAASLLKKASSQMHWTHQGRVELQAACNL
jgi:hypothetical protein